MNPVDFIFQEGITAAKVLSSKVDVGKLRVIVAEETMILKHAVTFTQAQSILYFTSSENPSENEDLVMRTLKEHREETTARSPFDLAPFLPDLVDNLRTHVQENSDGLSTIFSKSGKFTQLLLSVFTNLTNVIAIPGVITSICRVAGKCSP